MLKTCNCKKCCREIDVCNREICGKPEVLSIFAPVIYDEIGVNVCRTVTLPASVLRENPTVEKIRLDVADISLSKKTDISQKDMENCKVPPCHHVKTRVSCTNKPNCSKISLTNVYVTFNVKLYDGCNKYLDETGITVNYLPADKYSPDYKYMNEKTNPSVISLELYTPYGVGTKGNKDKKYINVVSLAEGKNQVANGINITGIGKAMNFNACDGTFSAGLSLILRTVYYEAYKIDYIGRTVPPKASIEDEEKKICKRFVENGLLSREIKPLELEPPKCEGKLKKEIKCDNESCTTVIENLCEDKECTERAKEEECEHHQD